MVVKRLGYTEVNLRVPMVPGVELPALLLVVPDTPSGIEVPILLDANVLMSLKRKFNDILGNKSIKPECSMATHSSIIVH